MNTKDIESIASNIVAHWRSMNQTPKLGKLILLKAHDVNENNYTFAENKRIFKTYNCVPIDIMKYRLSVGFIQKSGMKNEFEFVMCDYMYDSNYYKPGEYDYALGTSERDMIAPFSTLFFEKWIYIEELINL